MRLYRHALESIFAMLELEDLSRVLAVSHEWSAVVKSMKPVNATHNPWPMTATGAVLRPFPPIERLVASPLVRHLATFEFWPDLTNNSTTPLSREDIALLVQHAPNLVSLDCSVSLKTAAPWILPAKLTTLKLELLGPLFSASINALFVRASALPALETLCLWFQLHFRSTGVDFGLLGACSSLKDFTFRFQHAGCQSLSNAQITQIRTSLGHLRRFSVDDTSADTLSRFLQPPVPVRWQEINQVWLDERTAALLSKLPSLTSLHLACDEDRPHLDFLSQLPQLTALELWSGKRFDEEQEQTFDVAPTAVLNALLPCTGLTELHLRCRFNSAQLTVLFAKLTALTKLTIRGGLDSLLCFKSGPITQTLEELRLEELGLPPSELVRMYALRHLRSLALDGCFSPPLSAAMVDSISPPTRLLPMLTEFVSEPRDDEPDDDFVERKGPSFQWMQKRLTQ